MMEPVPDVELAEVMKAARKASAFVLSQIDAQGRFGAAQHSIFAYFKAPLCLLASGEQPYAGWTLAWMRKRFLRDADYCGAQGDPTLPRLHMYRNAWVVLALKAMGQDASAQRTAQRLVEHLHPEFGGLLDHPVSAGEEPSYEVGGSCAAVCALLACGRTTDALRVGHFLRQRLMAADDRRWILRVGSDGREIDPASDESRIYDEIRYGEAGQAYWYLGFTIQACMRLHDATADPLWIDTANRAFGLLERCGENVFTSLTNSKVAWGCASLYLSTGCERSRAIVLRILRWLVDTQVAEGTWIRKPATCFAQQSLASSLEVAMERAYTLREITMAMNLAGHRWTPST